MNCLYINRFERIPRVTDARYEARAAFRIILVGTFALLVCCNTFYCISSSWTHNRRLLLEVS